MGLNANSIVTVQKVRHNVSAIEKPRHTEILVMKAATGSDGRDGRNGYDGRDGIDGQDGEVFVPHVNDRGVIEWTKEANPESASSINMLANIASITNVEILNIVNS